MGRKLIYTNAYGQSFEFSDEQNVYVTAVDGMSQNQVSLSESYVANQIGTTVNGNKVEARDISIEGLFPYNPIKKKKILSAILPGVQANIRYIDELEGIDVYIEGYPTETPTIDWDRYWSNFAFVFHAAYPYWMQSNESAIDFVYYESAFQFPRSFSSTVAWKITNKVINQLMTIDNQGSVESGFIARFIAKDEVKGPQLLKVDTQEVIELPDLELTVGDVLVISTVENDRYTRLIRDGVEQNVFFYTSFDSTFFKLVPGNNPIRFDAKEGVSDLEVSLEYHTTYAGV